MPHIDPPHADGREPETAPPVGVSSARPTAQDRPDHETSTALPTSAETAGRRRLLVVTNDFPPRLGGIQSFVHNALLGLPPDEVVVYASDHPGAATFDAAQPFEVIRDRRHMLLPTPAVRRRVVTALREHGASAVWFGAAAPLGLLAPALRAAGAQRIVATTHGHEAGWAALPGARSLLRRIGRDVDVLTYLGEYTRSRLSAVVGPGVAMARLAPGVDAAEFSPGADGASVRARHHLGDAPVVVCVSRLVRRKGQDTLIAAWPAIRTRVPGARLLIVGRGPYDAELHRLAERAGVAADVVFTGGVPDTELAAHVAAGDVFAMPCRTRRRGLDVEGLGIVYLEASACARPVVAGNSGGAPDAVVEGETGYVVDGRDLGAVTERVVQLLLDPAERARLGQTGRAWVRAQWQWPQVSATLDALLQR